MSDDTNVALPLRPADGWRPAHYSHSGAGPVNVNAGTGVQKNYSQSGGSGNRQFIADVIHYAERVDTRPDYTGTYSYRSLQPVATYVARPGLQKTVEERLHNAPGGGAPRNSTLILVGLGGAGKSQLALNYIQQHREDYSAVFWVDARLRESVVRDYIQIYGLLFSGGQDAASVQLDTERVITAVKSWFNGRDGRWLFVFDNADSLDDETDPYFVDLRRYLPDAPCIETIITTRSRTATGMAELEAVEVGKLAPAEAVDIFMRCSKLHSPTPNVLEEAGRIVKELDYLALAITLAGAYVATPPIGSTISSNILEYLSNYRQQRKKLLSEKAKQLIHQYGESVLSTWETSRAAIANQCPTAVWLLSFLAFLDPECISRELFDWVAKHSEDRGDRLKDILSADVPLEKVLHDALKALSKYSLIQWEEEQSGYSMHKLVHAWGFERLEEKEQGEYSRGSLAFLEWVIEGRELSPVGKSRIAPHIASSVARLQEWRRRSCEVPESSLDLVHTLANFLCDAGQYHAELELRWFEQSERERVREEDKLGWLRSLSDLASVLWRRGEYSKAEEMNRRAIDGYEKVLGKQHPETLASVGNLALVLWRRGKYEAAEEMNRRALEGSEEVLGKEHPGTLTSVNNLALMLQDQGMYSEAEEMYRRALEGYEKVLGKEHPDTLNSVSNVASVLRHQGKYEAAEEMNRRALEGREKVLGKEHADTLISVWCLADVLHRLGQRDEAILLYKRASTGFVAALGKQHPNTIECQRQYRAAEN